MIELITHKKKTLPSGIVMYVDATHRLADDIGRQEVTIEGAIDAQSDMPVYAFIGDNIEYGLDPWRYMEGLDPWVDGENVDVWFESGTCTKIDRTNSHIRFFVDKKYT